MISKTVFTKLSAVLLCVLLAVLFVSCDAPGVFRLDDALPQLSDDTAGIQNILSVTIEDLSSGESVSFSEASEINAVRMRFEGIKYIREKAAGTEETGYRVTFITDGGKNDLTLSFSSSDSFTMGEYRCDIMYSGIDTVYFAGLFDK